MMGQTTGGSTEALGVVKNVVNWICVYRSPQVLCDNQDRAKVLEELREVVMSTDKLFYFGKGSRIGSTCSALRGAVAMHKNFGQAAKPASVDWLLHTFPMHLPDEV